MYECIDNLTLLGKNTDWRVSEHGAEYLDKIERENLRICRRITDFRLSRLFIIHVNYVLRLLHRVVLSDIPDVSDVHVSSIIWVGVCSLTSVCIYSTVIYIYNMYVANTSTFQMYMVCASETSATSPTTKQYSSLRLELNVRWRILCNLELENLYS